VAGAHDDDIPPPRGERGDRLGQTDAAEDRGRGDRW